MLYLAGHDAPVPSRGTVIHIEVSPFAPNERLLENFGRRATDGEGFARRLLWQWSEQWKMDPSVFLDLIALASGGTDVTLCDGWGNVPYAPRRVLADVLQRIARAEGERRRRVRRMARIRRIGRDLAGVMGAEAFDDEPA
jgi:hypothetical protein